MKTTYRTLPRASIACLVTLLLLPLFAVSSAVSQPFDQTLTLQGISFQVSCTNEGSLNDLQIIPNGLEIDNRMISRKEIDGSVTGAEVADLNKDGSPELYIYINSAGSGSYGSLIAYSANNKKSLSTIYLPPLEEDSEHARGYMGHDRFFVTETTLIRQFPIYRDGDSNANPTGGTRQLDYILAAGEANWQLKLAQVSNLAYDTEI